MEGGQPAFCAPLPGQPFSLSFHPPTETELVPTQAQGAKAKAKGKGGKVNALKPKTSQSSVNQFMLL